MIKAMPMMMAGQIPNIGEMIAGMGSMMMGLGLAGLLALFAAYITPSAIFHFLNGTFADAFKFGSVLKKHSAELMEWLGHCSSLYSMVLVSVLGFIPYVGSGAATFIAGITGFSLMGEAFSGSSEAKAVKAMPEKAVKKRGSKLAIIYQFVVCSRYAKRRPQFLCLFCFRDDLSC